ncbi:MAG: cobalamin-independent methionine synthase II family protein [Actinobacteria bacterium]|nr:cobalamin-independent methionine synthase II family protein [Actinomycetota bacterium]
MAGPAVEPFATLVVGSLPRPAWIRELIEERKHGGLDAGEADALLDDAVPSAIRLQERAGLDFVSDGEWRRESYVKVFSDAVAGFKPDLIKPPAGSTGAAYPAVVAPLRQERPIALAEAEFLRDHTQRRVLVAVPSPYTIARRMWSPEHSTGAYPTREAFLEACIPILNGELRRLAKAGVDALQLDDPWLALLVDPVYRERAGIADIEHEIDLAITGVNGAVEGVDHPFISVHLCHAHGNRRHSTRGPYHLIIGALARMQVQRLAMEFATPDAGGIDVLRDFPNDKVLGLGVIDHTDVHVESPATVVARAEAALQYVPRERLTLNPDCGFAPSSINPMDLDEAFLKLRALCAGARLLRAKYGVAA